MNIFHKLLPEDLYHSYIIEGDPEKTGEELLIYLKEKKIIIDNDPDILFEKHESLSMSDSIRIKEWHSQLPIKKEGNKICIISTNFLNREAEQALLKIIEEPGKKTKFFLITPNPYILKDTTRSRSHIIKDKSKTNLEIETLVNKIIKSGVKTRLEIINQEIKKNKDEESSGQLRMFAKILLTEIEKNIYIEFKNKKNKNNVFVLEEINKCKEYLNNPGSSSKMILEHIAMII